MTILLVSFLVSCEKEEETSEPCKNYVFNLKEGDLFKQVSEIPTSPEMGFAIWDSLEFKGCFSQDGRALIKELNSSKMTPIIRPNEQTVLMIGNEYRVLKETSDSLTFQFTPSILRYLIKL